MSDSDDGIQYADRLFAAPVDLGIAQTRPGRLIGAVRHRELPERPRRRGRSWYEGGGAVGEPAVQGITIYPPTGGVQTQGDPFEPVKIGILIDMDLGQLLADWIDPTILAIEDAMNEGVWGRSPVAAGRRRRPWAAPGELPQGHRRLRVARRAGLRRRPRSDDLRQLASCCRTPPTSWGCRDRLDRRAPVRLASTASRSPTATSRPKA